MFPIPPILPIKTLDRIRRICRILLSEIRGRGHPVILSLLLCLPASAQGIPKYGEFFQRKTAASGYSPATDGNVFEWLKADAIGQGNNTAVSTWTASTGVNVVNPNSGATQPTFETSQQNGLPAVAFNGANATYLATSSTFTSQAQPFTIVLVFKDGDGANFTIPIGSIAGGTSYEWSDQGGGYYDIVAGNNQTRSPHPLATDGNWHIMMVVFSDSSSKFKLDNGGAHLTFVEVFRPGGAGSIFLSPAPKGLTGRAGWPRRSSRR